MKVYRNNSKFRGANFSKKPYNFILYTFKIADNRNRHIKVGKVNTEEKRAKCENTNKDDKIGWKIRSFRHIFKRLLFYYTIYARMPI